MLFFFLNKTASIISFSPILQNIFFSLPASSNTSVFPWSRSRILYDSSMSDRAFSLIFFSFLSRSSCISRVSSRAYPFGMRKLRASVRDTSMISQGFPLFAIRTSISTVRVSDIENYYDRSQYIKIIRKESDFHSILIQGKF